MAPRRLAPIIALVLAATAAAGQGFELQLQPGGNIPIGPAAASGYTLYSIGGGIDLDVAYSFSAPSWLTVHGRAGYDLAPTTAQTMLSLVSLGGGTGVRFGLTRALEVRLSATGGYSLALYQADLGGSPFLGADVSLAYRLTPLISMGIGASYTHFFLTYQALAASLGMRFRLVPAKQNPRLQVPGVELLPVFPVFYKYYNDNPLGSITLRNGEKQRITDVKVFFFAKSYMDSPKESPAVAVMEPGEEIQVPLLALFTTGILDVTQGTKTPAELTIEYTMKGDTVTLGRVETLDVLNRNAMVWDDDRKAAAFITELDPGVLKYAKNIGGLARDTGTPAVSAVFRQALAIFESFPLYGLRYVVDPSSSYAELSAKKSAIDYLQFPIQTLTYKAGDCDDLAILYCALLKSIGIETALITVPGHIYAAFCLPLALDEVRGLFSSTEDLIFLDDQAWVPVEITMISEGFLRAWKSGAKQWREGTAAGVARLYPVSKAWDIYPPTGFVPKDAEVTAVDAASMQVRYASALEAFITQEIRGKVAALTEEIRTSRNDPKTINRLGVLYARYGLFDRAEEQFARASKQNFLASTVNLGNLLFLRKDMERAGQMYARVLAKEPDNALALLGLARVDFEKGNSSSVAALYARLEKKNPDLARKNGYLLSRQSDEVRASQRAESPDIPWSD